MVKLNTEDQSSKRVFNWLIYMMIQRRQFDPQIFFILSQISHHRSAATYKIKMSANPH
nr:hypothetical protein Itr_chr06CG08510 [Ipomoea trifida]